MSVHTETSRFHHSLDEWRLRAASTNAFRWTARHGRFAKHLTPSADEIERVLMVCVSVFMCYLEVRFQPACRACPSSKSLWKCIFGMVELQIALTFKHEADVTNHKKSIHSVHRCCSNRNLLHPRIRNYARRLRTRAYAFLSRSCSED